MKQPTTDHGVLVPLGRRVTTHTRDWLAARAAAEKRTVAEILEDLIRKVTR